MTAGSSRTETPSDLELPSGAEPNSLCRPRSESESNLWTTGTSIPRYPIAPERPANNTLAFSPCSGTFKVPEGSDDEGSECGQDGGADDTIEESSTRRNSGARDAWARHSGPSAPPVVDLTGPRAGRPRICEVIDLSSPCPSPIHIIDDDEDAEEPTNHMATDEFDTPDDVDAANDLEIGDTIVAHPVDGAAHHIYDPRSRDYDDDMDDLVDDLEDLVDDLADSSAEDEEDDNDADPDGYGSHVGDDFYRDDESHLDYSDEHSDSQLGTSDDSGSDDDIGSSAEDVESDLDLMAHRDLMFDSRYPPLPNLARLG